MMERDMGVLLVDMGNSRIKWAAARGGALGAVHSVAHEGDLRPFLDHPAWRDAVLPGRLVVVSVLGAELNAVLVHWVQQHWQLPVEFMVARREGWGIRSRYHQPQQLGADRWAALVAARAMCGGACCICDCGTALTLDVLGADGSHRGGLIMPGLQMMRHALGRGTDAIGVMAEAELDTLPLFAANTRDAVLGGTLYNMVAVIERFAQDVRHALGEEPQQVISGGDSGQLLPLLRGGVRHEPHLVLQGALIMAGQNS